MATSQIRFHDCFDFLAGESKPRKCKCPNRVAPSEARRLVASGKAKLLNSRSIVSLTVHSAGTAISEDFTETDRQFIRAFRTLVPELNLSNSDALDAIKDPQNAIGARAHGASCQLSESYWNKVLADQKLSISRGQFVSDAPHGQGELIYGGRGSEEVSNFRALFNKLISRRVKAANFRKGEFNDGIIGSVGAAPDDFDSGLLPLQEQATTNTRRFDPYKAELNAYFKWEIGEISANVLSLMKNGYSAEKILTEILQNVFPVFDKKPVILNCRECDVATMRILNVPKNVGVLDKQTFICKFCVREGLYAVLKPEDLGSLNALLNTPIETLKTSESLRDIPLGEAAVLAS
jgi:hypothetical protein